MNKLRKISGNDIRLLLAAVLCLAVLVASSDSGLCSKVGKIVAQNNSDFRVLVKVSGPESSSFYVDGNASASVAVKVGTYQWTAAEVGTPYGQMVSGSCVVKHNVDGVIVISF
jgi:hypothetical protein